MCGYGYRTKGDGCPASEPLDRSETPDIAQTEQVLAKTHPRADRTCVIRTRSAIATHSAPGKPQLAGRFHATADVTLSSRPCRCDDPLEALHGPRE